MATETFSLQSGVLESQGVHRHAWSKRYSTSLRSSDHGIRARYVPLSVPVPATTGEPTRILIVDDVLTTGPLESLLHGLGYWTTRVALCGETALETAQDFSPSLVLLALELPDMSSYSVATQLRDQAGGQQLRLIALTADYAHTGRDLARRAGFERYLAKPVSVSALNDLLRSSGS